MEKMDLHDWQKGNTKVKIYRDGSCSAVYSDSRIFKPPDVIIKYSEDLSVYIPERDDSLMGRLPSALPRDKHIYKNEIRADSMKRAVDKVYDIAFQNEWSYFLTCTIAEGDFDRNSPQEVYKKLRYWLSDRVKRDGFKYLLIPEYHPQKKQGIHFHALINDVLTFEDSGRCLYSDGKAWRREDLEKRGIDTTAYKTIYNVPCWKYGYSTAIPVSGSPARLACYITKYITKDCKKIFGKFYLSSRNCVRDVEVKVFNTDVYSEITTKPINKGGVNLKYTSDFRLKDNDERDPSAEIIKYLEEKERDYLAKD